MTLPRKFFIAAAALLLVAAALFAQGAKDKAPAQPPPAADAKAGGVLKMATSTKIGSLNPLIYKLNDESTLIYKTNMRLYDYFPSEDGTTFVLKGEMAAGPPEMVGEGGTVWRIRLREGMKWANGDDLDADDVYYTWRMCLDPKLINARAATLSKDFIEIKNAQKYYLQGKPGAEPVAWEDVGLKQVDKLTLEVTTAAMTNATEVMMHLALPANSMVYEPIYEACMNEDRTENLYGTDDAKYMSCGKFSLEKWVRDAEFQFKKNPFYVFADEIHFDAEVLKVVPDQNTQLQMFENGELDYVSLSGANKKRYEQDPRLVLEPENAVSHICVNSVNPEQPLLGSLDFRKALYYGTDRATIARLLGNNPANYMVPTTHVIDVAAGKRYRDSDAGKALIEPNNSYEPEKAKALFDKALKEAGVDKVTLKFFYADNETNRVRTEFLQKSWAELFGEDRFACVLSAMPSKQLADLRMRWRETPNCYELTWGGWFGIDIAPWNAMKFWVSTRVQKDVPYESEEFDANYKRANLGEDRFEPGVRERCVGDMERLLLENVAMIPVTQGIRTYIKNDKLRLRMKNWANVIGFAWDFASFE